MELFLNAIYRPITQSRMPVFECDTRSSEYSFAAGSLTSSPSRQILPSTTMPTFARGELVLEMLLHILTRPLNCFRRRNLVGIHCCADYLIEYELRTVSNLQWFFWGIHSFIFSSTAHGGQCSTNSETHCSSMNLFTCM